MNGFPFFVSFVYTFEILSSSCQSVHLWQCNYKLTRNKTVFIKTCWIGNFSNRYSYKKNVEHRNLQSNHWKWVFSIRIIRIPVGPFYHNHIFTIMILAFDCRYYVRFFCRHIYWQSRYHLQRLSLPQKQKPSKTTISLWEYIHLFEDLQSIV